MSAGMTQTYVWAQQNAHIKSAFVRETIAEFFATLLLLFFVVGAGLNSILHEDSHAIPIFGSVFGLMVCILIFGGISGAHLNPAVSVGLALAGHLKWTKVPFYIAAQIFGGWIGSLLSYILYKDHIKYHIVNESPQCQQVADISIPDCDVLLNGRIMEAFSPPGVGTSLGIGLLTEVILTCILLMAVMAVIDKGNMTVPPHLVAFLLALTVAALSMTNSVTGAMLNPARDLCPRLAAKALGWDYRLCFQNVTFEGKVQEWWVVGIFGPIIGACIGVLLYNFVVGAQLTNNRDELDLPVANDDWKQNSQFIPRPVQPPLSPTVYNGQQPPPALYNGNPGNNGNYNPAYQGENMKPQRQAGYY